MATYTTSAKVQNELPDSLPTNFVTNNMTEMIADASGLVDAMVGTAYGYNYNSSAQKFPDITDSPATPAVIELCARWLAAAEGYVRLKELNKFSGKDMETKFRGQAMDLLAMIRDGDIVVGVSGANIQTSLVGSKTDVHLYDSDSTDPIFDDDSFGAF